MLTPVLQLVGLASVAAGLALLVAGSRGRRSRCRPGRGDAPSPERLLACARELGAGPPAQPGGGLHVPLRAELVSAPADGAADLTPRSVPVGCSALVELCSDALADRSVVLLGAPGAGRSTLIRAVVAYAAGTDRAVLAVDPAELGTHSVAEAACRQLRGQLPRVVAADVWPLLTGHRLCIAVDGAPSEAPLLRTVIESAARQGVHLLVSLDEPAVPDWLHPLVIDGLVDAVTLHGVDVEALDGTLVPLAAAVRALPPERRAAVGNPLLWHILQRAGALSPETITRLGLGTLDGPDLLVAAWREGAPAPVPLAGLAATMQHRRTAGVRLAELEIRRLRSRLVVLAATAVPITTGAIGSAAVVGGGSWLEAVVGAFLVVVLTRSLARPYRWIPAQAGRVAASVIGSVLAVALTVTGLWLLFASDVHDDLRDPEALETLGYLWISVGLIMGPLALNLMVLGALRSRLDAQAEVELRAPAVRRTVAVHRWAWAGLAAFYGGLLSTGLLPLGSAAAVTVCSGLLGLGVGQNLAGYEAVLRARLALGDHVAAGLLPPAADLGPVVAWFQSTGLALSTARGLEPVHPTLGTALADGSVGPWRLRDRYLQVDQAMR